jgi:hypothetical protein
MLFEAQNQNPAINRVAKNQRIPLPQINDQFSSIELRSASSPS